MSRIEELIREKCPEGVEYIRLEELCSIITKQTGFDYSSTIKPTLVKEASQDTYAFIQNKDFYGDKINLSTDYYIPIAVAEKYPKITLDTPSLLISLSGKVGNVGFYGLDNKAFIGGAVGICKLKDGIVGKFVMHYLMSAEGQKYLFKSVKAASHVNLTVESIRDTPIPVPPIEVQKEIVRILDKFTELEAELQTELDARKKQFEYYREWLTSFDDEVNTIEMTLGDIYDFQYGKGNNIPTEGGEYPVYGSNGIAGWHHEYNSEDAPVIGHIGAYAGIVNWASGKHFVTYNGVICKHKNSDVNKRYAYYLLMKQDFLSEQKGAQPFVSYDSLKKPIVKIPPMKEQERLVRMFDIFNIICSDYKNGLPAEIAARHKQYEYYRDKLLTFKRKEV